MLLETCSVYVYSSDVGEILKFLEEQAACKTANNKQRINKGENFI
jgi:hypothetical protein